jgi:hypothetical protein
MGALPSLWFRLSPLHSQLMYISLEWLRFVDRGQQALCIAVSDDFYDEGRVVFGLMVRRLGTRRAQQPLSPSLSPCLLLFFCEQCRRSSQRACEPPRCAQVMRHFYTVFDMTQQRVALAHVGSEGDVVPPPPRWPHVDGGESNATE